jgi:hypothetical protein
MADFNRMRGTIGERIRRRQCSIVRSWRTVQVDDRDRNRSACFIRPELQPGPAPILTRGASRTY